MAKTLWWFCNVCGFKNHPRDQRVYPQTLEINEGCEQCGGSRAGGVDFAPGTSAGGA